MKTEYRQRLPHIQPVGAAFFVTFRLYGSLPKNSFQPLKVRYDKKFNELNVQPLNTHQRNLVIFTLRKQYLVEYDALLHKINTGPMHLSNSNIREILKQQLHRFDNELYTLICYCIMSNHVHILIDTNTQLSEITNDNQIDMNYKTLDVIMKKIKGPSAWNSNKYLGTHGQFWERESFDMYIRNEKMLTNVISYILENPVKARMVEKWNDYSGNYLKIHS
jgi:REP element-mobilizing transposase RayT